MPILTDHWWFMILITFQYFTVLGTFIFETYILNSDIFCWYINFLYFFFRMWLRKCWLHEHFPITHYRFLSRGLWETMFHTINKTSLYAKALSMETKNFLGPWKDGPFPMLTKELSMFIIKEITCFWQKIPLCIICRYETIIQCKDFLKGCFNTTNRYAIIFDLLNLMPKI